MGLSDARPTIGSTTRWFRDMTYDTVIFVSKMNGKYNLCSPLETGIIKADNNTSTFKVIF